MSILFTPEPIYENAEQKTAGGPYPAQAIAGSALHNVAIATAGGVNLSASDPAAYTYAVVQVSTAALKYTTDGTAPSATVGMNVAVGGSLTMNYALFNVAKFYSATGTLDIEFYV